MFGLEKFTEPMRWTFVLRAFVVGGEEICFFELMSLRKVRPTGRPLEHIPSSLSSTYSFLSLRAHSPIERENEKFSCVHRSFWYTC